MSFVDDTIKELPPRHELEHNVHFELLVEDLVQLDAVGMRDLFVWFSSML